MQRAPGFDAIAATRARFVETSPALEHLRQVQVALTSVGVLEQHAGALSQLDTAIFARRSRMNTVTATYTARAAVMRQLSRSKTTRMPRISSILPNTSRMKREKKFERAITSPSRRSIISPGVCEV